MLSPCGSLLYSGDSEGDLRVWDVEDRRTVSALRLHPSEGGVLGLFLCSAPSRQLLSQGREGTIKLWKLDESGREVIDDAGSENPSRSSSSSPSSSSPPRPVTTTVTGSKGFCVLSAVEAEKELFAAVASEDAASVAVFDARRGELLCELGEAEAAAAAASGAVLDGGKTEETKKRRGQRGGEDGGGRGEGGGGRGGGGGAETEQQQQPKSRGMAMAVSLFFPLSSPDAALHAFVGYEDGSVVLWRCFDRGGRGMGEASKNDDGGGDARATATSSPHALASLRIHFDAVTAVATAHPVSTGRRRSPLRFFSAGADSVLASYLVEVAPDSSSLSLSLRPGPAAKLPARGVGALAVLSKGDGEGEGTLVVAGGWDGTIRLLALQASEGESESEDDETLPSSPRLPLEPLGELEHHVAPIAALAFDDSGGMLASGGRDGSVALWDFSGL